MTSSGAADDAMASRRRPVGRSPRSYAATPALSATIEIFPENSRLRMGSIMEGDITSSRTSRRQPGVGGNVFRKAAPRGGREVKRMNQSEALSMVRSLANGVDPASGEVFPAESPDQAAVEGQRLSVT